ncbi:hypothetical protein J7E87_06330 [Streptomyces sp. ISL-1]|uniref:hypothetical protein n=1 Tax=Streptomyces sp. ISL-1 TaxID=2817657 RepID=UPI001BEC0676|nr:hypothetical protein [Streptomyces sp. ISL-1]MBT2389047.1 hypothetical protein [Streptomyces sp. ISL-1]
MATRMLWDATWYWPLLYALARQRYATSDARRARGALDRGIALYEAIRPEVAVEEAEHEGTLETYRLMLELRIELVMKDGWMDQSLDLIERSKARLGPSSWSPGTAKKWTSSDQLTQPRSLARRQSCSTTSSARTPPSWPTTGLAGPLCCSSTWQKRVCEN